MVHISKGPVTNDVTDEEAHCQSAFLATTLFNSFPYTLKTRRVSQLLKIAMLVRRKIFILLGRQFPDFIGERSSHRERGSAESQWRVNCFIPPASTRRKCCHCAPQLQEVVADCHSWRARRSWHRAERLKKTLDAYAEALKLLN
jgi:hypothetical protein